MKNVTLTLLLSLMFFGCVMDYNDPMQKINLTSGQYFIGYHDKDYKHGKLVEDTKISIITFTESYITEEILTKMILLHGEVFINAE